jgi:ketosteroid isomerase-like protein
VRFRSVVVIGWWMGLMLLAVVRGATAQVDPVAVQQQWLDALARGDVAGALALLTDDAVIDAPSGPCLPAPCVGKAAIRTDLERLVAARSRRVTPLQTYVAGPLLVTQFDARSDRIRQAGVDRILIWSIREMRGDKIAVIRCCLADRTDPQTARFLDWERTHPPQP